MSVFRTQALLLLRGRFFQTAERSLCSGSQTNEDNRRLSNRLLYRSQQRGWLELDLLMGLWAKQQIPSMSTQMLKDYSIVLDQENPDLYKWLTGQLAPPESMQTNTAFQALQQHVSQQMLQNSEPAAKAEPGKEWVRGWDDSWRAPSGTGQKGSTS